MMLCEDWQRNYVKQHCKNWLANIEVIDYKIQSRLKTDLSERALAVHRKRVKAAHHTIEITRALRQYRACVE